MEKKNEEAVAKIEETLPVDAGVFDGMDSGFEGTSNDTFKTPFIKVLQQLSPELKRNDPKYIEGAQSGQFCNTATNECSDTIEVIVLKIEHALIAWKPNRGGFVGRYGKEEESRVVTKMDGLKKWDADGNEVIDTIEFYCLDARNPGSVFILPLSTTSLKYAKNFATRMRLLRVNGKPAPVSWAGVWKIGTVEERNDKGSWYTIGSTPEFIRVITMGEKQEQIAPAKDMLKRVEIDYKAIESDSSHSVSAESTEY